MSEEIENSVKITEFLQKLTDLGLLMNNCGSCFLNKD